MNKFIVAEITKNWSTGMSPIPIISIQFEQVINTNLKRGYKLIEWKFNVTATEEVLTETIIAIFELDTDNFRNL